jgi:hypothetical protein
MFDDFLHVPYVSDKHMILRAMFPYLATLRSYCILSQWIVSILALGKVCCLGEACEKYSGGKPWFWLWWSLGQTKWLNIGTYIGIIRCLWIPVPSKSQIFGLLLLHLYTLHPSSPAMFVFHVVFVQCWLSHDSYPIAAVWWSLLLFPFKIPRIYSWPQGLYTAIWSCRHNTL